MILVVAWKPERKRWRQNTFSNWYFSIRVDAHMHFKEVDYLKELPRAFSWMLCAIVSMLKMQQRWFHTSKVISVTRKLRMCIASWWKYQSRPRALKAWFRNFGNFHRWVLELGPQNIKISEMVKCFRLFFSVKLITGRYRISGHSYWDIFLCLQYDV